MALERKQELIAGTLRDADGKELPVFRRGDQIWLEAPQGPSPWPVLCTSIPKCGTNVLTELVVQLGWHQVCVHPIEDRLGDWRYFTADDVFRFENDWYRIPFAQAAEWIHAGQVAATHVHPDNVLASAARFKTVFIRRNLRDACVSHMRHREKSRRLLAGAAGQGSRQERMRNYAWAEQDFQQWAVAIGRWAEQPGVFQLSYEELFDGDLGRAVAHLAAFLETEVPSGAVERVRDELARGETVTYSGQRSRPGDFWSDEVEDWFWDSGLQAINAQLGYEPCRYLYVPPEFLALPYVPQVAAPVARAA